VIDWNVRIGDLAVIGSLAGTCLFYAFRSGRFAESIMTMQKEITELKEVAKSMMVVITQQAVASVRADLQGERMNSMEKKIEDLRHGNGFIVKK